MKSFLTLAAILAVLPTASQAAQPAPDPAPSVQDLEHRVTQLDNRARTHARQLGLRPGPAERPASDPAALARQERRLSRVVGFLSGRDELTLAVDERRLPSRRGAAALPARIAHEYTRAARRAVHLGIRMPPPPRPAATPQARRQQLAYWRSVADWLGARRERVRPSERPLSQRVPHYDAWMCIARHESHATWDIATGNGYYGGLQMDRQFQQYYAPDLYRSKGTADHWTAEEQMMTAEKAVRERGFSPWPNTARMCGVL